VYRVLLPDGRAQGYALGPVGHAEPAIDPERDYVEQLQVHVFHCEEAARAFQEGLILGGDEDTASIVGLTALGWAVLRECGYPPDDDRDPTVTVITY